MFPMEFGTETILDKQTIVPPDARKYSLFSGIFHHGSSIHGGHYNCFTWNYETGQWILFDDDKAAPLAEPPSRSRNISQLVYKLSE